ncbi:dihydroxyacetone kinase family protein [Amnibacterium endophyticum]|uniref:Dihydroxyacetone kinase family protein n=1 Tax=Amnibacterium endophyticum TaxID=2109337 RepID=A0ABW4LDR5_9MICO
MSAAMTRLFNDPADFTEEALAGFVQLHADLVQAVPGGVVRATETPPGKVAVVIGGGSGHYPAFCGVVGDGFADGAVVGNIFTSPATSDAISVAKAADGGGGVLFSFGNYAGDVMNFGLAQQRLRAEGIDTRTVLVTDDIASAGRDEVHKRRGIAGDFVVFKIAGAAAEEGYDLDGVERVAIAANDRTRTLGVAFAGCTIPGQDEPLFQVPAGRMAVGLGIHGEPGIAEEPQPTADELAERLVSAVLAEAPQDGGRVGVILNGLGTTKYEELFVVWRSVAPRLADAGFEVVAPEVGELVTSLDMAGCSLTVVFLDEELERLWTAPATTPAFRRGSTAASGSAQRRRPEDAASAADDDGVPDASDASKAVAGTVTRALGAIAEAMREHESELARLDSVAGDGDHGRGMVRGSHAGVEAAEAARDAGAGSATVLRRAGDAWGASAGGTSGVLWGAALAAAGDRLGDEAEIGSADVVEAVAAGIAAVRELGKAEPGDKTMLDAMVPFADALTAEAEQKSLPDAWSAATDAAEQAAQGTAELSPRIGRARPLAHKSVGTPDPGAVSFGLAMRAVGQVISGEHEESA